MLLKQALKGGASMKRKWALLGVLMVAIAVLALGYGAIAKQGCNCATSSFERSGDISVEAHIKNLKTGELIQLPVHQQLVYAIEGATGRQVAIKYIAEVPSAALGISQNSDTDNSVSYRLTITQYYEDFHYTTGYVDQWYVAVDKYVGEWESLDPQVTGTDGYLEAGVSGRVLGGGWLYRTPYSPHFLPGDWATRTLYPSWAGTYIEVNAYGSYQCGLIHVTLLREPTGRTWEFDLSICKGNTPW